MGLNIIQKRKQLEELSAQLALIQREVHELESNNPEFTTRIKELEQNKKKIFDDLKSPIVINFENFLEITCIWEGVEEWPQIIDWKFKFDNELNQFLEKTLINDEQIALLFETKHKKVKELHCILSKIDKQVQKHNEDVEKIFKESQDEAVLSLSISSNID